MRGTLFLVRRRLARRRSLWLGGVDRLPESRRDRLLRDRRVRVQNLPTCDRQSRDRAQRRLLRPNLRHDRRRRLRHARQLGS